MRKISTKENITIRVHMRALSREGNPTCAQDLHRRCTVGGLTKLKRNGGLQEKACRPPVIVFHYFSR
jgi:hypothetical protein